MDSFKHIWCPPEGCSSSESGWTMYIDSPMQEDDARCSNENDGYINHHHHEIYGEKSRRKKKVDEDQESDDSMASDASSGPTNYHHQSYARGGQGSQGRSVSKKDHKQDHGSKKKNGNKQEKKRVDSRSKK
jgi:hypothetical protein